MKTKNTDLINIILSSWVKPNLLVNSFVIVWKLIKKHGRMLFTEKYISEISSVDQNIWNLLSVLKSVNKVKYQDIKLLVKSTKTLADDYQLEFKVVSDSDNHNDELKAHIDTKFQNAIINTGINKQSDQADINHLWVNISWEWRYFKKDLDSDLEKLLG